MPLTQDDLITLKRHFEAHEHEFLNGAAYIREEAITERIEEVDPNWTLEILNKNARQTYGRDVSIIVNVRLTIQGVSRDGVGMNKVTPKTGEWKDKSQWANKDKANKKTDWIEYDEADYSEVNEAEKSAATDALKRAARLFGIGRYLLSLPKWVKDEVKMSSWLMGGNMQNSNADSPNFNERGNQRSGSPDDAQIATGTRKTVILKSLRVTINGNEKRLIFTTDENGVKVTAYTRKLFIEGLWCTEADWLKAGQFALPANIPATIEWSGKAWTLVSVLPYDGKKETEVA